MPCEIFKFQKVGAAPTIAPKPLKPVFRSQGAVSIANSSSSQIVVITPGYAPQIATAKVPIPQVKASLNFFYIFVISNDEIVSFSCLVNFRFNPIYFLNFLCPFLTKTFVHLSLPRR